MSDPRKTFKCLKCGFEINDTDRTMGKDTPCDNCLQIEFYNSTVRGGGFLNGPSVIDKQKESTVGINIQFKAGMTFEMDVYEGQSNDEAVRIYRELGINRENKIPVLVSNSDFDMIVSDVTKLSTPNYMSFDENYIVMVRGTLIDRVIDTDTISRQSTSETLRAKSEYLYKQELKRMVNNKYGLNQEVIRGDESTSSKEVAEAHLTNLMTGFLKENNRDE